MPPRGRGKKARRKSPKTVSLWNLGVGWVYLTSFTKMATGAGPVQFLLGEGDLSLKSLADDGSTDQWLGAYANGMGR